MFSWLAIHVGFSAIIIFIGLLISALGGLLPSPKKRINKIVIFVGALIFALGSIYASFESVKLEHDLRQKSDQIEVAYRDIITKTEKIVDLNHQIVEKSETIAKLNLEIAKSVTGGNSYPYVFPFFYEEKAGMNILTLVLTNSAEYPLYDLKVRIADKDKYEGLIKEKGANLTSYDWNKIISSISLGTLAPKQTTYLRSFELLKDVQLNFDFTARNGFFFEKFRIRKVNGEWKTAYRVYKTTSNDLFLRDDAKATMLKEAVDPGFPLTKKGTVDW
jgi:hypothetical protein